MGLDMYLYRKSVQEAGYWRKANAIHGWFDRLKENGLENCEDITITVDTLKSLRDDCAMVLESKSEETAMELLPPTEGFFFGGSEIDEYYWAYVKDTYELTTKLINESNEDDLFEYHAWW